MMITGILTRVISPIVISARSQRNPASRPAPTKITRDAIGLSPVLSDMQTAVLVGHEIGFHHEIITSILLNRCVNAGTASIEEIEFFYFPASHNVQICHLCDTDAQHSISRLF